MLYLSKTGWYEGRVHGRAVKVLASEVEDRMDFLPPSLSVILPTRWNPFVRLSAPGCTVSVHGDELLAVSHSLSLLVDSL